MNTIMTNGQNNIHMAHLLCYYLHFCCIFEINFSETFVFYLIKLLIMNRVENF